MLAVNFIATLFPRNAKRLAALRAAWGRAKDQPRNIPAIAGYHQAQIAIGATALDAHTCTDLDLDGVFTALDRTDSPIGQQVLYHRLLAGSATADDLSGFERLVDDLGRTPARREPLQLALQTLRNQASLDVWTLTEPNVLPDTGWYAVFPFLALASLVTIIAIPFWHPALVLLLLSTMVSIGLRVSIASWLLVVAGPFRQIAPLLNVAEQIAAIVPAEISSAVARVGDDARALDRLKRIAGLAKRDTGAPGDLAGLAMEYFNLVFYLDGNALFLGRRELLRHADALARVITAVGTVDAAISVASWRAEHTQWSRPEFGGHELRAESLWHPLLADPVVNAVTMTAGEGLIVTGSNMSGKTTYLRTLGVAAVMAQTIHTVPAARYSAPTLAVRTSIGRDDSLTEGKSYYVAEAESVLAAVRASAGEAACLFLFDELFRGTNLVERLAAGEAVLRALVEARRKHFVVVATHDGELVDMLAGVYVPVHFDGAIVDGELRFDYRVRPGRATSRNAIALLQQLGAPDALIAAATARAAELDARPGADLIT